MPAWLAITLIGLGSVIGLTLIVSTWAILHYMPQILRIIKDLPVYPHAVDEELREGEPVQFRAADGVPLAGRYLPSRLQPRRGVVIFSHEFGSVADSAVRYAGFLLDRGFDLFTFDYRGHGRSGNLDHYEPLQWPSHQELKDLRAAVDYVYSRPDAPSNGVAVLGVSRGAGTAISTAARDPRIRVVVTDGAFAPRDTIVAYVKRWAEIYVRLKFIGRRLPTWFCVKVYWMVRLLSRRHFRAWFLPVERDIRRLSPRPLFMVHGANDTYIPVSLSQKLFARAGQPKRHWIVPQARHNQCYLAGQSEYADRITEALEQGLSADTIPFGAGRAAPLGSEAAGTP